MRTTLLVLALAVAACSSPSAPPEVGLIDAGARDTLPTFALVDVNPASPTVGVRVSTADLDGRVSAWYFGHSS